MPWEAGYHRALEAFRRLNPLVAAAKSGAPFQDGQFSMSFFQRRFLIAYPEGRALEAGSERKPPLGIQILLLHYLAQATGAERADRWMAYRELPGAYLFQGKFEQMAIKPLARAFGQDAEGFRRAGLALGGIPLARTGDAGFRFLALPRIPMACFLYLGEEEIPASVNVLFDASAPQYLPTEDLSILGLQFSLALQKLK